MEILEADPTPEISSPELYIYGKFMEVLSPSSNLRSIRVDLPRLVRVS